MNQQEALQLLKESGAIRKGHFVLTSGRHSERYVNKDGVSPHTGKISELCQGIAENFINEDPPVEVVIAPATGGIALSQWTAHHLTMLTGREVLSVYAEKSGDGKRFVIGRGFDQLLPQKNVLVVEDILTTGGSAKGVVEATRAAGGNVIGLGALCNRGGIVAADVGNVPAFFALITINLETWNEEDCPLCAQNVPINTDVGKGKRFLEQKQARNAS